VWRLQREETLQIAGMIIIAKHNEQQLVSTMTSCLMVASAEGYMPISCLLLCYQAEVNMQDKKGWSALMFAVAAGHVDLIVHLLGKGAEINMQDTEGTSPLMLSCFTGHLRITKVLLAHDADVNLQNGEGLTALMMGSYNGHTEIVELLIKYHADIDAVTCIGKSALDFSTDKGHDEVSKLLIEYGGRERVCSNLGKRKLSMRDPNREKSAISTSSNSELEERLERMEQILQTLLQNQQSQITHSDMPFQAIASFMQSETKPALTLQTTFKLMAPLAHDWQNIGIMLNLDGHLLKEIEHDYRKVRDCLREMLSLWLSGTPTWKELAQALDDSDYQGMARKVRRVYEQA